MLTIISLITSLSIGIFYPLCFLIHARSPLKQGFHRFHLGMPLVVGGVASLFLLFGEITLFTKGLLILWGTTLACFTLFYWKKESPRALPIALASLLGLFAFASTQFELLNDLSLTKNMILINILAGLILCASLHSMTLGHHYLNVRGLPMTHLSHANNVLWILLGLRLLWDLTFLFYGKMAYGGDEISIAQFSLKLDGFLLWIGIFFGTLFPFVTLFFVKAILKFRNTQSATGILYVVLCSVLMGDLAYKYYWVKFGISL